MLNAELAALDKKYDKADEMYKQAISHALQNDHLHRAALFDERSAEFRRDVHGDKEAGNTTWAKRFGITLSGVLLVKPDR
jgi:hypothetical protein